MGWTWEHPCHTLNVIRKNFWTRVRWGDRSVATGAGAEVGLHWGVKRVLQSILRHSSSPKVGPICLQGQVPSSTGSSWKELELHCLDRNAHCWASGWLGSSGPFSKPRPRVRNLWENTKIRSDSPPSTPGECLVALGLPACVPCATSLDQTHGRAPAGPHGPYTGPERATSVMIKAKSGHKKYSKRSGNYQL